MEEILSTLQENHAYVIASVNGVGNYVGRIKGITYDANNTPIIEVDIDSVSCTKTIPVSQTEIELLAKDWCIENGKTYKGNDDNGVYYINEDSTTSYHSLIAEEATNEN